jgi:hypothetical protein
MSQANVERLQAVYALVNNDYEALKRGEFDALMPFFDPDVVIEYLDAPDPERYEAIRAARS